MWKEMIEELGWLNRYVAVWTFGWVYRGYLSKVGDQALVLQDVHTVDVGREFSLEAMQETAIPSAVLLSLDSIEQICIPCWASHNAKI